MVQFAKCELTSSLKPLLADCISDLISKYIFLLVFYVYNKNTITLLKLLNEKKKVLIVFCEAADL